MTTLVTPREVIDLAFADGGYLPPEAIGTVDIAAAEARYLLPVTGPALWQKLAEGEYPTLREEFAAPAAACAVRVAMQPALDLHGGAGGTAERAARPSPNPPPASRPDNSSSPHRTGPCGTGSRRCCTPSRITSTHTRPITRNTLPKRTSCTGC